MLCCVVAVVGVDCCGFCQKYWVYTHELWVLSSVWVASSLLRGETWWIWSLRWLFPGLEWLASDLCAILGSQSFLTTPAVSGGCFPTLLDQEQSEEPPRAEMTPSWQSPQNQGAAALYQITEILRKLRAAVQYVSFSDVSIPTLTCLFFFWGEKKKEATYSTMCRALIISWVLFSFNLLGVL